MHETCADLGDLGDDPVLLFGGPYSNLAAMRALLAQARSLRIAPERMICTGDICAYCAHPAETARMVMQAGCAVVRGNCEESLGKRLADCGCGFAEGATCDRFAMEWFAYADAALDDAIRDWMRARPAAVTFLHAGRRFGAIHGGARQINRFIWPVASNAELADEIGAFEAAFGPVDGIVAGHSGIPFERRVPTPGGEKHWINAGAIGLPAHDGDPRTHFAVLAGGRIVFHPLEYDWRAEAQAMRQAGLRAGYDRSLESGWWPSEDSFPQAMRRGLTSLDPAPSARADASP